MLTLVRGLCGSGKSTFAKSLGMYHVEADMWFYKNGIYQYDINYIREAHNWCKDKTIEALQIGIDVVVSNTFTKIYFELMPYINIANALNTEFCIYEMKGEYQTVHDVPEDKLAIMKARWEELPEELLQYRRN